MVLGYVLGENCKSNVLKLGALKNGLTAVLSVGHVSAGTWCASENNPCCSCRGKTSCPVRKNIQTFSLQNLQEMVSTCLCICLSNFSQINRLFSTSLFQQLIMCLFAIRPLDWTRSRRSHANDSDISSSRIQ